MTPMFRIPVRRPTLAALIASMVLAACSPDVVDPTSPIIDAVRVSAPGGEKGGGGDETGGGTIAVAATDPSELPRGVVSVDLIVTGSGFEPGSEVAFEIDGTATDRIVTNTITYIDGSTLIANVDVASDALVTFYDVAVRNGPKKKGVGVDLLKIVAPEAYPVVDGVRMFEQDDDGYLILYDAENGKVVGNHGSCGWIYDVETGTRSACLSAPGYTLANPKAINSSGRIAGIGYPDGDNGPSVGFVIDPPYSSVVFLTVDGWDLVRPFAVNSAGEIAAELVRSRVVTKGKGRVQSEESERALAHFAPDLSLRAVSAPTDQYFSSVGFLSENGLVVSAGVGVWDGLDGSSHFTPDDGGFVEASVQGITPEGTLLGGAKQGTEFLPVAWPDPWGAPVRLSDFALGMARSVDDVGNLLVWSGEDAFCIGSSGISRLTPLPGYGRAQARAGTGGVIFGLSSNPESDQPHRTFTVWDVSAGC